MDIAGMRSKMWDRHDIILEGTEERGTFSVVRTPPVTVRGSVNVTNRQVVDQNGKEVTVTATLRWHPDGPRPKIGALVTLPDYFGVKPHREVITTRVVDSGTGMTPAHVEVTVR